MIPCHQSCVSAVVTLRRIYMKPNNETFIRHMFITQSQVSGVPLDHSLQVIKFHANDCRFKAKLAVEAWDSYTQNTFINILSSHAIDCSYGLHVL